MKRYLLTYKAGFTKDSKNGKAVEFESDNKNTFDTALTTSRGYAERYYSRFFYEVDDFKKHWEQKKSYAGYKGECFAEYLYFDIDFADDLERALTETRHLLSHCLDALKLEPENVLVFFSGGKGFHVCIPIFIFGESMKPGVGFQNRLKQLAVGIAQRAGVPIDSGVYGAGLMRLPNSRHDKSKLYKIPLPVREFRDSLTVEKIKELARTPQRIRYIENVQTEGEGGDRALFCPIENIVPEAERLAKEILEAGKSPLLDACNLFDVPNDSNIKPSQNATPEKSVPNSAGLCETQEFSSQSVPRLRKSSRDFIWNGASEGFRNHTLFETACDFFRCGWCVNPVISILTEAGTACGLESAEISRTIQSALDSVRRDYPSLEIPDGRDLDIATVLFLRGNGQASRVTDAVRDLANCKVSDSAILSLVVDVMKKCYNQRMGHELENSIKNALASAGFKKWEVPDYGYLLESFEREQPGLSSVTVEVVNETETEKETNIICTPDSIPSELYALPGFMGECYRDMLNNSPIPQPEFALATALCAQSILCGRKFASPTDARANIYCLCFGPSACGKSKMQEYLTRLFGEIGLGRTVRHGYASYQGIQNDLRTGIKLFCWDECGRRFQALNSPRAGSHETQMIPFMTKIFSESGYSYTPEIRAEIIDEKLARNYEPIEYPFLSLLGMATPEQLFDGITGSMVEDGFFGRVLLFTGKVEPNWIPPEEDKSLRVSKRVKTLAKEHLEGWDTLKTEELRYADSANEIMHDFKKLAYKNMARNEAEGILWGRAVEYAHKLALLYAVSENPERPQFTENATRWGVKLSEFLTERRFALAKDRISENPFDAKQKEIFRFIKENSPVTRTQIARRFKHWSGDERKKILDNLIDAGEIGYRKEETGGANATVFFSKKP